jgi:ribosomal protein S1
MKKRTNKMNINEIILADCSGEELHELEKRIHTEYARREAVAREKAYGKFIEAYKELRKHCPNDEMWITFENDDGDEVDVDLLEAIADRIDKFHKYKAGY